MSFAASFAEVRTAIAKWTIRGERGRRMHKPVTLWTSLRWIIVLLSLAGWFALSNHCALAAPVETDGSVSEMSGCPMHSAPAKKRPAVKTPCCKDIRAVVAKSAKVLNVAFRAANPIDYPAALPLPPSRTAAFVILSLDTGPPRALSFAEVVLQESMLAHAPPVS